MELEAIKEDLRIIGNRLSSKIINLDCYLFGSVLTNAKQANDIDILIIYENQEQLEIVKNDFEILSISIPLHMNYFTSLEEQELNFIWEQNAEEVFSL